MELRQTRKMTEQGLLQFEESVLDFTSKLSMIKRDIDRIISESESGVDLAHSQQIINSVQKHLESYDVLSDKYEAFLKDHRSVESTNEQYSHRLVRASLHAKTTAFIEQVQSVLPRVESSTRKALSSVPSNISGRSGSSHLTAVWMQHSANVEKAKTRMKYAEEEAELIRQEAALKASRNLLTVKRELEEAESGLSAIRKVLDFSQSGSRSMESDHGSYKPSLSASKSHVLRYMQDNKNDHTPPPEVPAEVNLHACDNNKPFPMEAKETPPLLCAPGNKIDELNPSAVPFTPKQTSTEAADLAKLVAKNQLLPRRLWNFNDDPGRYLTWKYSFMNVMSEISATTLEHLDLLVNHLGPESRIQAENIRATNSRNPEKAVKDVWERLDREYGSAETIELSLKKRINKFVILTDGDRKKFLDLSDLAAEVESVKCDPVFGTAFSYYDTSSGINEFVHKLPKRFREKWASECDRYKMNNCVSQVPFSVFTKFLRDLARVRNDPSLVFETSSTNTGHGTSQTAQQKNKTGPRNSHGQTTVSTRKTNIATDLNSNVSSVSCPIHGTNSSHSLKDCVKFREKTVKERKDYLYKNGYCLKCCGPKRHRRKYCRKTVKCDTCGSMDHVTILHPEPEPGVSHEGEELQLSTYCTKICGTQYSTSKSCAKILPVYVYPVGEECRARKVYCMIDDQSNKSLATSAFFDAFGECGRETEYILSSCSGKSVSSGRRASGYIVRSVDESCTLRLPCVVECNDIPDNRHEIPSPAVADAYTHLRDIAPFIPDIDDSAGIELLIGRDLIAAHHVLDQRVGKDGLPYGQKLHLGWAIIGDVCLGKVHQPDVISVNKTSVLMNGRSTHLLPCENEFLVEEEPIFQRTPGDEKPGLSIEDRKFLDIMDAGFQRTSEGQWQAPLPFRDRRPVLPDNKTLALKRAGSLDISLRCNHLKREQVREFMERLFMNGHAELAPELPLSLERWYLPMFAVYHPKKPNNVRLVFDSSAKFQDVSLNSVLLQGPDLCNSLLGVLLRFRREKIAVTMDVEQMFHNFKVPEDQRRYLRFLWHLDNDLDQPLVDFQMTVHVFGNSPSPAIATFGLRKVVEGSSEDIRDLVCNNFYVDDGLLSSTTEEEAISLVHRTKKALQDGGNIRLHKFSSNSRKVLDSFVPDDLAKNLKNLDFGSTTLPIQRSLGLLWNTEMDEFTFKVNAVEKAYTRRGLLSIINSVYDPIGFAQPVIIRGKLLLREMMSVTTNADWDEPLPASLNDEWSSWVDSLSQLENLCVPRSYNSSFLNSTRREVLVFCDASKDIIAAVAYLKLQDNDMSSTSFLLGKAKVAPVHGHTIPRLELCAAVLATEIAEFVRDQLNIPAQDFHFFSDSQIVLGYISNESRRFYVYVGNRVARIRLFSNPSQWRFVRSEHNPADVATRPVHASTLQDSSWICGPHSLLSNSVEDFKLVDPEHDTEIRPDVICNRTDTADVTQSNRESKSSTCQTEVFSERFTRFSSWKILVHAVARLKFVARRFQKDKDNLPSSPSDPELLKESEHSILASVQRDVFSAEFLRIEDGMDIPRSSTIRPLCPRIHADGLLHVGGRLNNVSVDVLNDNMRNPIILPKNHHVSYLIIRHLHQKIFHQGRHFTEGAVRSAGFWVVSSRRMTASVIKNCVTCRKLRGQPGWQHMADLPEDRCTPCAPFSYVGVDTFGPWPVVYRRTRGGSSNQKRWAILFTCFVTRAIHIEVIEELTSGAFINALRRFCAVRGQVTQFRSDRGTNFVGAVNDLNIDAEFIENGPVSKFLSDSRIVWKFNPPHAPHMGGAWERLIGVSKKILNAMLLDHKLRDITHDVLITFMAEVCAIVNNRPLTDVSNDPEAPRLLTPTMLLTMKTKQDTESFPSFGTKDALKSTWKRVQVLAEEFWHRWKTEYVHNLQHRKSGKATL